MFSHWFIQRGDFIVILQSKYGNHLYSNGNLSSEFHPVFLTILTYSRYCEFFFGTGPGAFIQASPNMG